MSDDLAEMGERVLPSLVSSLLSGVLSFSLTLPLTIPTQMFTGGRGSGNGGACVARGLCGAGLALGPELWWALGTATLPSLRAPFPWFGGKSLVADALWARLGATGPAACQHYIEPFLGSAAVLLARPGGAGKVETVNDADGFLVNLWRALRAAPAELAAAVVGPVAELDLHARHLVLLERKAQLVTLLLSDPYAYDLELAAWWLFGQCAWIGDGWCSGEKGAWGRLEDGTFGAVPAAHAGPRVWRKLPRFGDAGVGIHTPGVDVPSLFAALAQRLARVRIAQGDWARVLGPSVLRVAKGPGHPVAIFLDPPYAMHEGVYSSQPGSISAAVREWALAHGDDPNFRIALCGYEGEHAMPDSWSVFAWKAKGGYGSQSDKQGRKNSARERIWFSPHCLVPGGNGRGPMEWW
jgi:DNA adenine methylase